jgi:glycosyltransferase involved in cell wall biosynthesis
MPVFNAEKFLDAAIQSVINQTFTNFELIILNDGSTDGSVGIIESYDDPRITLINNHKNLGLVATLNRGIKLSTGSYIARMDADDISHPTRFEKQIELMQIMNADICGCHWDVINEKSRIIGNILVPLGNDFFISSLSNGVPFAHGSVMMRTKFLKINKLLYGGEPYAEDFKLWIEFFEKSAVFVNCNEFLYMYRDVKSSLSKVKRKEYHQTSIKLRRAFVVNHYNACLKSSKNILANYEDLSSNEILELWVLFFYLSLNNYKNTYFLIKLFFLGSLKIKIYGFYRLIKS